MIGTCCVCGCIDDEACPGGCSWVDAGHTLCSRCDALPIAQQKRRRAEAFAALMQRAEVLGCAIESLCRRMDVLRAAKGKRPNRKPRSPKQSPYYRGRKETAAAP